VNFYKFLEKIGLSERKSLTLGPLNVPENYFSNFLRGVIDGDGNIQKTIHTTNRNVQWSLKIVSASPNFLPWLKRIIKKLYSLEGKIYKSSHRNRKNPLYVLKFGKFAAKIILRDCYVKGQIAMQRKLKIAQECIQSRNGLSKYRSLKAT